MIASIPTEAGPRDAGAGGGLRANRGQVVALVAMTVFVGAMVGQERTVVPLIAGDVFGLRDFSAALAFIGAFGAVKAVTNFAAGALGDRLGRRPVLLLGWALGIPVPLLLLWAPSWGWIVAANVLLGVNQGLTWSMAVIMKLDLAGDGERGFAAGLNEAAGYSGLAVAAWATGLLAARYGLRPAPFLLGIAVAVLGSLVALLAARETAPGSRRSDEVVTASAGEVVTASAGEVVTASAGEVVTTSAGSRRATDVETVRPALRATFATTTLHDPTMSASVQAGFMNNLNDVAAWGLFPLWFSRAGLSTATIGVLTALYPAVWGLGQLVTGPLSDRVGRKPMIAGGMAVQAVALAVVAMGGSTLPWALGSVLLGVGTALVYPTLIAAVGDVAAPAWRSTAIGVYRLWRDLGLAAGALLLGWAADALGLQNAIWLAALLTAASGWLVAVRMREA